MKEYSKDPPPNHSYEAEFYLEGVNQYSNCKAKIAAILPTS